MPDASEASAPPGPPLLLGCPTPPQGGPCSLRPGLIDFIQIYWSIVSLAQVQETERLQADAAAWAALPAEERREREAALHQAQGQLKVGPLGWACVCVALFCIQAYVRVVALVIFGMVKALVLFLNRRHVEAVSKASGSPIWPSLCFCSTPLSVSEGWLGEEARWTILCFWCHPVWIRAGQPAAMCLLSSLLPLFLPCSTTSPVPFPPPRSTTSGSRLS